MCRKLTYLISFVLLPGLALTSPTQAELVGWWRMEEGSGAVAYDSSGYGRDGAFNGDPEWVAGYFGGALEFDGDDHLDTGYSENLTNWTIAAWVRSPAAPSGDAPSGPVHREQNYQFNWNHSDATYRGAAAINVGGTWYAAKYEPLEADTWYYLTASYNGEDLKAYRDGVLITTNSTPSGPPSSEGNTLKIARHAAAAQFFTGIVDEVSVYDEALTDDEVMSIMYGGGGYPYALNPSPADRAIHLDTWITLSWRPGDFAASHDVYLGDNFDDVNDGTGDTFRGNQVADFYIAGFPGYAYPEGLVPGTTYYWRIDEVNAPPDETIHKGDVWSFSIPPRKAYAPDPADGADSVPVNAELTWTPGLGAKLHTMYFGEDYDTVANATGGIPVGGASYNPGPLKTAKIYYWRVDEFDAITTYKGDVWSFTTEGAVSNPNPADGAMNIKQTPILTWTPAIPAASHEIYFGSDEEAVRNATPASPEYKGSKALGDENYAPGKLEWNTAYYWRIDEVNDTNPDSPWVGRVWSFTTADFVIIDDFEDYTDDDMAGEAIWQSWIDGFGVDTNGSQVGNLLPPYAEQTIVHSGLQSMPLFYDNTAGITNSEAVLMLTEARDWTEQGVAELSLWFRGNPGSVGSFTEGPAGTYTMTASGADIWNNSDEFHYTYKTLTGAGSIVAKVESLQNTNSWAKAGVMIRETLDAGSKHGMMIISAASGASFQRRTDTDGASTSDDIAGISAPYWVKLERTPAGMFGASYSEDGITWRSAGASLNISMGATVHIGLAVTSHDTALTCEAVFSNVTTTGNVSVQWTNQDIGIASNAAEPLYVAVSNASGAPAVVAHENPAAATIETWTEWRIPLQEFADQGINLTNVDKIAIGLGSKSGMASAGGSGTMYIDDIRLYRPAP